VGFADLLLDREREYRLLSVQSPSPCRIRNSSWVGDWFGNLGEAAVTLGTSTLGARKRIVLRTAAGTGMDSCVGPLAASATRTVEDPNEAPHQPPGHRPAGHPEAGALEATTVGSSQARNASTLATSAPTPSPPTSKGACQATAEARRSTRGARTRSRMAVAARGSTQPSPSVTKSPVARLSAKSWTSRLAYLLSRS